MELRAPTRNTIQPTINSNEFFLYRTKYVSRRRRMVRTNDATRSKIWKNSIRSANFLSKFVFLIIFQNFLNHLHKENAFFSFISFILCINNTRIARELSLQPRIFQKLVSRTLVIEKGQSVEGVLKLNEEFCSVKGNLWRTIGAYINSQKQRGQRWSCGLDRNQRP